MKMELEDVINICVGKLEYYLISLEAHGEENYKVEFQPGAELERVIVEKTRVESAPVELRLTYWRPAFYIGDNMVSLTLSVSFLRSEKEFDDKNALADAIETLVIRGRGMGGEYP